MPFLSAKLTSMLRCDSNGVHPDIQPGLYNWGVVYSAVPIISYHKNSWIVAERGYFTFRIPSVVCPCSTNVQYANAFVLWWCCQLGYRNLHAEQLACSSCVFTHYFFYPSSLHLKQTTILVFHIIALLCNFWSWRKNWRWYFGKG